MSKLHSVNHEQGLYVINCGAGYTCLGFEVAERWSAGVAAWLGEVFTPLVRGTEEAYRAYESLMERGGRFATQTRKRCEIQLTPQLKGLEGKVVEVVDKYDEKRRFRVGKSMGWMPVHLEIPLRGDTSGGPAAMGAPYKSVRVIK